MALVDFHTPVEGIHGKMDKNAKIIMRKKIYRAPNGSVLKEGTQESYSIVNPRDFTRNKPKGNELANMRSFGNISLQASEIIRSGKYTEQELGDMTAEQRAHVAELRQQLESYRDRFYAQFKRPDPEAPFENKPRPGSIKPVRRQYSKLDNFIQALIRERFRQNPAGN